MARRTVISTSKQLPPPLKKLVDRLISEDRTTQGEILALVNVKLEERGADLISRSALSRYATTMRAAGEKIRMRREIAAQWRRDMEDAPEGDVGRLLQETVCLVASDTADSLANGAAPSPPKEVMALARAVRDLQQAASLSAATEIKIREKAEKDAREAAAKKLDGALRQAAAEGERGLSAERVAQLRRDFLGVPGKAGE
jgi:hypothetical protein